MNDSPFWKRLAPQEMSPEQWESLCDGCGRCCLQKLEDIDSGDIFYTNVACHMLDDQSCRCRDYANRTQKVPDCLVLQPGETANVPWLPDTCAYRLVAEGKDLPDWHPLVSGDPDSVHSAGISVRKRVVSDKDVGVEAFEDHIIDWIKF